MAGSFEDAFAQVDGPELDAILGYWRPPWPHAPVADDVRDAFDGFDYDGHVGRIVRMLSAWRRCNEADVEDAVQDTLERLLVKRPELYREDPRRWLGLLYAASRLRLLGILASGERTESIQGLQELAGDAALAGARPCVPPSPDADEENRYAPAPAPGEEWSPSQITGAFQRFRDYRGRPPKARECRAINGLPSLTTIYRHFDGFAAAVLAAGMIPETIGCRRRRWGAVEAARECLGFRRRNGYWPGAAEARRSRGALPGEKAMIRFFGGTRSAEVQIGAEAILS